jgi:hypothetical protein
VWFHIGVFLHSNLHGGSGVGLDQSSWSYTYFGGLALKKNLPAIIFEGASVVDLEVLISRFLVRLCLCPFSSVWLIDASRWLWLFSSVKHVEI